MLTATFTSCVVTPRLRQSQDPRNRRDRIQLPHTTSNISAAVTHLRINIINTSCVNQFKAQKILCILGFVVRPPPTTAQSQSTGPSLLQEKDNHVPPSWRPTLRWSTAQTFDLNLTRPNFNTDPKTPLHLCHRVSERENGSAQQWSLLKHWTLDYRRELSGVSRRPSNVCGSRNVPPPCKMCAIRWRSAAVSVHLIKKN